MTRARHPRRDRRASAAAAGPAASLVLLLLGGVASAEPHFSVRTGLRCSRCHVSPTGGGKRTSYGALYAHTTLAMLPFGPRAEAPARDGASPSIPYVSGEVTPWLAVGADLRLAHTTTFGEETDNSFDATQGTLYLELRPWPDRITLYVDEEVSATGATNREAWAMIHGPWSTYLRGGRIFPPFGLRVLDDEAYQRRVTGANFAQPDLGLEAGVDLGPFFAAVALTNGTFAAGDTDEMKALSALVEVNLGLGRAGVSVFHNPTDEGCRTMVGGFGGLALWRLALHGEVDWITERPAGQARTYQLTAYGAVDFLVVRGLYARLGYDYHDGRIELNKMSRQRFRIGLDAFLFRMLELKASYVIKQTETDRPQDWADELELVLHAYL